MWQGAAGSNNHRVITNGGMAGRAATFTGVVASLLPVAVPRWLGRAFWARLIGLVVADIAWWERALYGFLGVPVLMVVGASLWSDAGEQRAAFARLRQSGRPEVVAVR